MSMMAENHDNATQEAPNGWYVTLTKRQFFWGSTLLLGVVHLLFWVWTTLHPLAFLVSLFTWAGATAFGLSLMGRAVCAVRDRLTALFLAFVLGQTALTALVFVLYHLNHGWGVGLGVALFSFGSLGMLVLRRKTLLDAVTALPTTLFTGGVLLFGLFVATALTVVSVYGFNRYGAAPHWGWNSDKLLHLHKFALPIARHGLPVPGLKFTHNFVQLYYLCQTELMGGHSFERMRDLYLLSGLPFYLITLYFLAYIGRCFFRLVKPRHQMVLLMGVAFLGAIDYPFFRLSINSYVPMINFTGYYHNTTLWISNMIAFGGILLFLHFLEEQRRVFTLAMVLFVGSFLFKPSFFTVLAPAAFLLFPFYVWPFTWDKLGALFIGLGVVAFWVLYPRIMGTPPGDLRIAFAPFQSLLFAVRGRIPSPLIHYEYLVLALVLLFSFPLLVPITIDRVAGAFRFHKDRVVIRCGFTICRQKVPLFFLLLLLFGLLEKLLFVERGKLGHGNFGWAAQSAQLAFLPLLFSLFFQVRMHLMRLVGWGILVWQLLNGFWKYVLFFTKKL